MVFFSVSFRAHGAAPNLPLGLERRGFPRQEQSNLLLAETSQLTGRPSSFSLAALVLPSARDMLN
jgi:hypothetical protein